MGKNITDVDQGGIERKIAQALLVSIRNISSDVELDQIQVGRTQDPKFGDFTSSAALSLAKKLNMSPLDLGQKIVDSLKPIEGVSTVQLVKPGFINFFQDLNVLKALPNLIDENFGKHREGDGKRVMVEFGQPNTHKAMTLGHFKSAVTGLSVVRLYQQLGYQVVQANFFGDIGMHVAKSLWGVITHYGYSLAEENVDIARIKSGLEELVQSESIHSAANFLDSCYVAGNVAFKNDDQKNEEIKKINSLLYDKSSPIINELYQITREISIKHQDQVFAELGISYDRQYPESEVYSLGVEKVKENVGKIFIKDDGALIFPGEKYGLNRWVFLTAEGNPTYSCKDMGLAFKKFDEYPDLELSVYTTSVEQIQYFKAVFKALELMDSKFAGKCKHIPFGWLLRGGKKMSSKGGALKFMDIMVDARESAAKMISESKQYSEEERDQISQKVAIAGLKFAILSHEFHKDVNYNPEQFFSFSGFSGPYILYSVARANSILAKSELEIEGENLSGDLADLYNEPAEIELLKVLSKWPEVSRNAATSISPHLICNYLFELANQFNSFYGGCPVLVEGDDRVTLTRLKLVNAFLMVTRNGLNLLGIESIERM